MCTTEQIHKVLAANQPYFFPYLPYFQLINAADVFVICDDYNFIKHGWITRNRILYQGEPSYFRVEVQNMSSHTLIRETVLKPVNVRKKMNQLQHAYGKAPYYEAGAALVESILSYETDRLDLFLEHGLRKVCDYLGITTELIRASELKGNAQYRREDRIYDMCRRLGADTYINAIGGGDLYDFDAFEQQGLTLKFIHGNLQAYPQWNHDFVGGLSIIDIIMFNSREEIRRMLEDYTFRTKEMSRRDEKHGAE